MLPPAWPVEKSIANSSNEAAQLERLFLCARRYREMSTTARTVIP